MKKTFFFFSIFKNDEWWKKKNCYEKQKNIYVHLLLRPDSRTSGYQKIIQSKRNLKF